MKVKGERGNMIVIEKKKEKRSWNRKGGNRGKKRELRRHKKVDTER
jgi:hypothetical protein